MSSDEDCLHIETSPSSPVNMVNTRLQMTIDGKSVEMEVDTGAAMTLISEKIWRSIGSPNLQPVHRVFTAYDGHMLKPIGELHCRLQGPSKKTVNASITVIASTRPYGLLGRDLLDQFDCIANSQINSASTFLPPMKVKPVSIDIADRSQLKFCKARPVPLPMLLSTNWRQKEY